MKKLFAGLAVGMTLVMAASGCGKGKASNITITGVNGPNVSFDGTNFSYTMTIADLALSVGATIPIPDMPNSSISATPSLQSNGLLLAVTINAVDLSNLLKVNPMPGSELPGGRPLPGITSGSLPGIALTVPALDNVTFYAGGSIFGLFVPVKLGISTVIATYQFYDPTGNQIGNISVVGSDSTGKNAGVLVLINVSGDVANSMQQAVDKSQN